MRTIIKRTLFNLLANTAALAVVVYAINTVNFAAEVSGFREELRVLILAGLVIGVINALIKPVIKMLSLPLIVLSLGLFYFVINAFILFLMTVIVPQIVFQDLTSYLLAAIVFSVVNTMEHWLFKPAKKD